jgi:hypothetical protein
MFKQINQKKRVKHGMMIADDKVRTFFFGDFSMIEVKLNP